MKYFFKYAQQEAALPYHPVASDKPYLSALSHELDLGYFIDAMSVTQIRFLEVEFALQAYKDEHGFYPKRPAGLCPALFTNLPSDPFSPSGASFKYHQMGKTYTLYSIGPDQKDDGRKMNRDDWRNPQSRLAVEAIL